MVVKYSMAIMAMLFPLIALADIAEQFFVFNTLKTKFVHPRLLAVRSVVWLVVLAVASGMLLIESTQVVMSTCGLLIFLSTVYLVLTSSKDKGVRYGYKY